MCNILELSRLFVCLGGLNKFFEVWGTEKIAGLWFTWFTKIKYPTDTFQGLYLDSKNAYQ